MEYTRPPPFRQDAHLAGETRRLSPTDASGPRRRTPNRHTLRRRQPSVLPRRRHGPRAARQAPLRARKSRPCSRPMSAAFSGGRTQRAELPCIDDCKGNATQTLPLQRLRTAARATRRRDNHFSDSEEVFSSSRVAGQRLTGFRGVSRQALSAVVGFQPAPPNRTCTFQRILLSSKSFITRFHLGFLASDRCPELHRRSALRNLCL
jgi:hypothetical protein